MTQQQKEQGQKSVTNLSMVINKCRIENFDKSSMTGDEYRQLLFDCDYLNNLFSTEQVVVDKKEQP